MTIEQIIRMTDETRINAISDEMKTRWIAELEGKLVAEVFHMALAEFANFAYTWPENKDTEPLAKYPHDDIYRYWLMCKIDFAVGEYSRYENDLQMFNALRDDFVAWFANTYAPERGYQGMCGKCQKPYYISAYGLAVKMGYKGTLDQWLDSLRGDGVEMRVDGNAIVWRWKPRDAESTDEWKQLLDISEVSVNAEIARSSAETAREAAGNALSAKIAAESAAAAAVEAKEQSSHSEAAAAAAKDRAEQVAAGIQSLQQYGVDATLSLEGFAADAKAAGEGERRLSESIAEIMDNDVKIHTLYASADLGLVDGTYVRNGEIRTADGYSATDFVPVKCGVAKLHLVSYSEANRQVCMYDDKKEYIGNADITTDYTYITGTAFDVTAAIPDGCAYIRFSIRSGVEGQTMQDGNIFHTADVNCENRYNKKLYLSLADGKNFATKGDLAAKQDIPKKITLFVITFDLGGDRLFNANENGSGASRFGIVHDEYALPFTSAVQIQSNGNIDLSADKAKMLEDAGCDLCLYSSYNLPYTVHGNDITTYYNEQYTPEWKAYFADALTKLNAIGGYSPTAWCCRYNRYGSALEKPLKELGFIMVRGNDVQGNKNTTSQRRVVSFAPESFMANTQTVQMSNLSEFLDVAQDCIENGDDYIITTHALYPNDEAANDGFSLTPAGLRTLCAWLKEKQDAGLCRVVTMREYARIRMGHIAEENDYLRIMQKINRMK